MTVRMRFMQPLPWRLAFDDLLDALECPVDLVARDHERRRQADDVVVRLLAEHSLFLQQLAIGTGEPGQFDADPQAASANLPDERASQRAQFREEVRAQLGGSLDEPLVDEHLERRAGHRAGQRVAAERAAVIARLEDAQHLASRQDRRDGVVASRQRLGDDHHVGLDVFPLVREQAAGAAEPRLDLVEDQQHVVPLADLLGLLEVSGGRDDDAGLALYGFDEKRRRVRGDGRFERRRVAEGDDPEPRRQRTEAVLVLGRAREADEADRAPVEVALAGDDLGLIVRDALDRVAPLSGGLQRRLHRLGAGVHGERHVHAGEVVQVLAEQGQLVVAERARRQRHALRLVEHRRHDARMAVSLVDRRVGGQAVQVALAVDVVHPHALGALDDDVERMVVVGTVLFLDVYEFLAAQRGRVHEKATSEGQNGLLFAIPEQRQQRHPDEEAVGRLLEVQRPRIVIDVLVDLDGPRQGDAGSSRPASSCAAAGR